MIATTALLGRYNNFILDLPMFVNTFHFRHFDCVSGCREQRRNCLSTAFKAKVIAIGAICDVCRTEFEFVLTPIYRGTTYSGVVRSGAVRAGDGW